MNLKLIPNKKSYWEFIRLLRADDRVQSGFIQDYGFSFFTMFRDYKNRFETFYMGTQIPILMISGNQDEIFEPEKLEDAYNLIENKDKKLIILEGETHTSIIWNAGPHIISWLEDVF